MVRITVLKKTWFEDVVSEYCHSAGAYGPCEEFEEGTVFEVEGIRSEDCPAHFCRWAWDSILRELRSASQGDSLPWVRAPHTFIACCTDGFRPVLFKIEGVE